MTFDEYQEAAAKTAVYPNLGLGVYPALGLGGESGEVLEKIKKFHRDHTGPLQPLGPIRENLKKELGDVLWYAAILAREFGLSLDDIAKGNLEKLADRAARGVLQGSGDNR